MILDTNLSTNLQDHFITIPMLAIRRLRLRKVKSLAPSYMSRKK